MYICTYIYAHIYTHICTYTYMYIHTYIYMYTHIYIYVYLCICIHIYTCIQDSTVAILERRWIHGGSEMQCVAVCCSVLQCAVANIMES